VATSTTSPWQLLLFQLLQRNFLRRSFWGGGRCWGAGADHETQDQKDAKQYGKLFHLFISYLSVLVEGTGKA